MGAKRSSPVSSAMYILQWQADFTEEAGEVWEVRWFHNKVWQTPRSMAEVVLTTHRCGDDVKSLSCYVDAQRIAFDKILKKYKVCAGNRGTILHEAVVY